MFTYKYNKCLQMCLQKIKISMITGIYGVCGLQKVPTLFSGNCVTITAQPIEGKVLSWLSENKSFMKFKISQAKNCSPPQDGCFTWGFPGPGKKYSFLIQERKLERECDKIHGCSDIFRYSFGFFNENQPINNKLTIFEEKSLKLNLLVVALNDSQTVRALLEWNDPLEHSGKPFYK
ncbi:MAG: hypothetical protein KDD58_04180 [Bdellovibrionales bacterium]|nr:hypothetical protein [Bdellovibrionales bacterium]